MEGDIYIKLNSKGSTGIDRWDSSDAWDDGYGGDVKEIFIWHGDVIHSIQTTYERNGVNIISNRHGGVGGNFEVVSIDEPLLWISGHHSSYCLEPELFYYDEEEAPYNYCMVIRSLKFGTARATFGPFGREFGEPFIYKSGIGGIGGFHGRSNDSDGGFLQAFGVYMRTMATDVIGGVPSRTAPAPTKGRLHSSSTARLLAHSSSGVVLLETPSAARMANPSSTKAALAESVDSMVGAKISTTASSMTLECTTPKLEST